MGSKFRIIFVILFFMGLLPVMPATAAPPDDFCLPDGVQPSGAIYRFCVPPNWNGDLVVFAHGYMAPD